MRIKKNTLISLFVAATLVFSAINVSAIQSAERGAAKNMDISSYGECSLSDGAVIGEENVLPNNSIAVFEGSDKKTEALNNVNDLSGHTEYETDLSGYTEYETIKVPLDEHTFQIVTPSGEVIATCDTNPVNPASVSRASWRYSWTVKPNVQTAGTDRFNSYEGLKIAVSTTFSSPGASRFGIACHDIPGVYWVFDKDDSFSGTITLNRDVGLISFAIRNNSDHTIIYSGIYSI